MVQRGNSSGYSSTARPQLVEEVATCSSSPRAIMVAQTGRLSDVNETTLSGRVAIVTGSSRGIGREIALSLARAGCDVVLAAKSVAEKPNLPGTIHSVAAEVRALGRKALPVQVDVRNDAQVLDMVAKTVKAFGRVDILVANSGALWWKSLADTPMSKYDLVHSVNARGVFSCVQAVLPVMKAQGFGRIIVMSPPVDLRWLKGKIAYLISKYGMTMIALGLAREVEGTGIAINALWPATFIESFATKNFKMAERSQWRKASIVADSVLRMVQEKPESLNGQAVIDEDYLRARGITDFTKYQCVPGIEPRKVWPPPDAEGVWLPTNTTGVPPGITYARL